MTDASCLFGSGFAGFEHQVSVTRCTVLGPRKSRIPSARTEQPGLVRATEDV